MKKSHSNWYATWFDTPYYHILYKNRDDKEAEDFMSNLTKNLELKKEASILDVACGKGRHAIYLNKIGYDVVGIDLSQNSIKFAKQFENDTLHFKEHDMCKPLDKQFDAIFNLFTSFGYFENDDSNVEAIKAMRANMKPDAHGVIDFLNIHYTLEHLKKYELKTIENIDFEIKKWVEDDHLFKEISFDVNEEHFSFIERLKCIDLEMFKYYFEEAGLEIERTYGNYQLEPYDQATSERLILVFRRKS
jgi:SAM-dependent methyltransferase